MPPITVLLVDDHTLFRSGIKALLQRHTEFAVVGEAGDTLSGVECARQLAPDVVLLDVHLPGVSGRAAVRSFLDVAPATHVVMLTVSEDAADLLACLKGGASGYLLKNVDTGTLLDSLRRAAAGDAVIAAQMTAKLIDALTPAVAPPPVVRDGHGLSQRELEILSCIVDGASNKEIARALAVAESTVKIHVQHILRKLALNSRVQAAIYAVEHGLVTRVVGA